LLDINKPNGCRIASFLMHVLVFGICTLLFCIYLQLSVETSLLPFMHKVTK